MGYNQRNRTRPNGLSDMISSLAVFLKIAYTPDRRLLSYADHELLARWLLAAAYGRSGQVRQMGTAHQTMNDIHSTKQVERTGSLGSRLLDGKRRTVSTGQWSVLLVSYEYPQVGFTFNTFYNESASFIVVLPYFRMMGADSVQQVLYDQNPVLVHDDELIHETLEAAANDQNFNLAEKLIKNYMAKLTSGEKIRSGLRPYYQESLMFD
ncbi:hypothetical protein SPFM6_00247 [Salmonella phage SPFM6]|nr:hypothetical protein SPFM6_00247 [Salmonella phage SPFM6]